MARAAKRNGNGTGNRQGFLRVNVEKKRQTYHVRVDLIPKLQAYAYWERLGISEVVNKALEKFFADKEVKAISPECSRSGER